MIRNIKTPHLPEGEVRHIIIGKKYRKSLENELIQHNLVPIWLDNNEFVDERLCGHADLSAIHIGENHIILSQYAENCEFCNNLYELGYKVEFTANPTTNRYPDDAGLNFCIIGDTIICNKKTVNEIAVKKSNYNTIINVNQGYTKCSVCIVDNHSIITSDRLIAEYTVDAGFNVLYIKEPVVKLDGFEYGFIGGASFKLNKNEIAFTGVISNSEIRNKIETFLNSRNVSPIYLTNEEIFDIGSAIPLTEEV